MASSKQAYLLVNKTVSPLNVCGRGSEQLTLTQGATHVLYSAKWACVIPGKCPPKWINIEWNLQILGMLEVWWNTLKRDHLFLNLPKVRLSALKGHEIKVFF